MIRKEKSEVKYIMPEIELIEFGMVDVIATSSGEDNEGAGDGPVIPEEGLPIV